MDKRVKPSYQYTYTAQREYNKWQHKQCQRFRHMYTYQSTQPCRVFFVMVVATKGEKTIPKRTGDVLDLKRGTGNVVARAHGVVDPRKQQEGVLVHETVHKRSRPQK